VGDTFVEVVSPITDDAPARRFLDRAGPDAGYMAIVLTAQGEGITGLHFHPADTDGTLLSIDRCEVEASWPWAGPAWEAAPDRGYRAVVSASLAVTEPAVVAARWAALLGTTADDDVLALDGSALKFVPRVEGRSGLVQVELAGSRRSPVTIAGVEFSSS
jgi:hypothetical protein